MLSPLCSLARSVGKPSVVCNPPNRIPKRSASWFKRKKVQPPCATQHKSLLNLPFNVNFNGKPINSLEDNYAWLQDVSQTTVQEYLNLENKYTSTMRSRISSKVTELHKEYLSIYHQIDRPTSVAERIGEYDYYTKNLKNKRFPLFCRTHSVSGNSEVILDANSVFQQFGFQYMHIGMLKVSPHHKKIAFTLDTIGQESYTLFINTINDSSSGIQKVADDVISIEWDSTGESIFFTTCDDLKRSCRVWRCYLDSVNKTEQIFEEKDISFYVDIGRTKDQRFLTISCNTKRCSEVRVLDLHAPNDPVLLQPRQENLEYFVEHSEGHFIIVTNEGNCPNYKIVKTSSYQLTTQMLQKSNWQTLIPSSDSIRIEDLDVFKHFLVVYERHDGCPRVRVVSLKNVSDNHVMELPEKLISIQPGINMNLDSSTVRLTYSSLITPECTLDYNLQTRTFQIVRRIKISDLGLGISPENLSYYQRKVTSKDTTVPLTLLHQSSLKMDGQNPVLLAAYGAYGHTTETKFQTEYLPFVKRGWIIALAHVRGGGELGAHWYEAGRQMKKQNSFEDFINCAEYLIANRYTSPHLMTAMAASAGGLLLGVVVNRRPDLFKALVMKVPFVDVTTSMLDDSLPLTKHEYDEWGNPTSSPKVLEYILSYDPYVNIRIPQPKVFPNILVTASTMDIRVPYWQPTKWIAKLRNAHLQSNNLQINENIFLKIYEDSGHFGEGGNRDTFWESAIEHGFLLDSLQSKG